MSLPCNLLPSFPCFLPTTSSHLLFNLAYLLSLAPHIFVSITPWASRTIWDLFLFASSYYYCIHLFTTHKSTSHLHILKHSRCLAIATNFPPESECLTNISKGFKLKACSALTPSVSDRCVHFQKRIIFAQNFEDLCSPGTEAD